MSAGRRGAEPAPGRRRSRRLVNRLVLVTVVAGLAAGSVGALLLRRADTAAAVDEARARNAVLAQQYAVRVDNRIDHIVEQLRMISTRRQIASLGPDAESELRVALRVARTVEELVLYDAAGAPRAAAASRFLADIAEYRDLDEEQLAAGALGIITLPPSQPQQVQVAVPVENPPGVHVGVLVARAPIEAVAAPLEAALPADDPVPFLVDLDGRILVHRDRSQVVTGEVFPLAYVTTESDLVDTVERRGEPHLVAAAATDRLPAYVVVELPEASARAGGQELRQVIVILLVVMAAVVLAVVATGELLLRPLRSLTAAVQRVGRGERGVRTGTSGHAEIGVLATEIDRMAESLDRRDVQVEELRDLSLMVGTPADRAEILGRIAAGVTKLVRADGAAIVPPVIVTPEDDERAGDASGEADHAEPAEVVVGRLPTASSVRELTVSACSTPAFVTHGEAPDGNAMLAVPLVGNDGERLAVVVVARATPFTEDEVELLLAFASFGAVALDNARRLALQHALADELQAAVDRRRDLIGTVTHEFRTPLTCIEGFSSALLDGWGEYGDDDRRELVGRIAHHSHELDDLVSRFLDFAVTERGAMTAQLRPMSLGAEVRRTVDALAPLLADRQVELDVLDVMVAADATLVRRTLTNLLSNAVKFSSTGSRVVIRTRVEPPSARLEVIDEGVGMDADDMEHAFEPFWRAGVTDTRAARGTGLGLALVREYVRVMHGTCGVTSQRGRGSVFHVLLPLAGQPAVPAATPADRSGDGDATQVAP